MSELFAEDPVYVRALGSVGGRKDRMVIAYHMMWREFQKDGCAAFRCERETPGELGGAVWG